MKKGVLKNFTIFTGKHLCWSLFLIKLQALRAATRTSIYICLKITTTISTIKSQLVEYTFVVCFIQNLHG